MKTHLSFSNRLLRIFARSLAILAVVLTAQASLIYTDFSIASGSSNVGTFSIANNTLYQLSQLSQSGGSVYNYAYRVFTPSATGNYTLGMTDANYDPVMILYSGLTSFPANPATGAIGFNDDGDWSLFSGRAPTPGTYDTVMPLLLDQPMTAGTNYLVAISTYYSGDTVQLPATFFLAGPGAAGLDGAPAAPASSALYWLGSAGDSWTAANNWSSNATGTPTGNFTASSDIVFSATGSSNETSTNLGGDQTIASLTINTTAPVGISGGNLTVNGDISVGSSSSNNSLQISNGVAASATSMWAGREAGSNDNQVTVGANATLAVTDLIDVGFHGSSNNLTITNGGAVSANYTSVGREAGSNNNAILVTSNASMLINNDLIVGEAGSSNSMTISDGGRVTSSVGYIGKDATSANNTVTVTGTNSTWTNNGTLHVGYQGSNNTLDILGSVSTGNMTLSHQVGSNDNTVTVGGGSNPASLSVGNLINVGFGGEGNSLEILGNGTVTAASTWVGGYGSNNTLEVTGGRLNNTSSLVVGYFSDFNTANITSGGNATVGSVTVGLDASSSNNTILVSGSGSALNTAGLIYLGENGTSNSLVVENGGKVHSQNQNVALGVNAGSNNNALTINGTGSHFSNNNTLYVGNSGSANSLTVSNGGNLTTANSRIGGEVTSSNNTATVSGAGSIWSNTGTLRVGSNGTANSLTIANGGQVNSAGDMFLGYDAGSANNLISVNGTGSKLVGANLTVGYGGSSNNLLVQNGGNLTLTQGLGIGYNAASANNTATVTGAGSTLTAQNIQIGAGANNKLIVADSATVSAANIALAGTNATLQIGNGTAAGNLSLSGGILTLGNATGQAVVFNHTDSAYTFGTILTGNLAVSQIGTGTTTLTANNTYTGSTTISAGTLSIGNGGTSGAITGNITNNAALVFNRSNSSNYSGSITGTGSLEKLGAGTTILTGNNTYTGGTTVSAGTLEGNSQSLQGAISNNASVVFNQSTNGTYAGIMSGNGTLSKTGNGALTLSGNNTFTGGTTIDAGTLIASGIMGDVTNYASFVVETGGTAGAVTNYFGAAGSNNGTTASLLNVGTFTNSGNITGSVISFDGVVTVAQSGRVSGNSTIGAGEFVVAGAVADVSNNALMRVETGGTTGAITNLGDATTTNNGTVVSLLSSGAFTNSGNITDSVVSFGTLESSGTIGGSLIVGGGVTTINGTVAGATTVTVTETTAGILQGTGTLGELEILSGGTVAPGTVGTIGNLTTGNMTWNSGGVYNWQTSSLNGTGMPGSAWDLINSNGSLTINASANSTVGIRVTSLGGNFTNDIKKAEWEIGDFDGGIEGFNKSYFSVNATGLGARGRFFVTAEEHSLVLNYKTAAVWLGGTGNWTTAALWEDNYIAVNGDEVEFSGNGGTSTNNNVNSVASLTFTSIASGSYTLNGNALAVGAAGIVNDSEFEHTIAMDLTANGTLSVNAASGNLVLSGIFSGASSLTKNGSQTLTLTGNNAYTGGTTVSTGTLALGGTAGSVSGNITVNAGATFAVNRTNDFTLGNLISGNGSFAHIGAGTTNMTVANTYTGGTTISSGTVWTQNTQALGNGSVTLNGGTLLTTSSQEAVMGNQTLSIRGNLDWTSGKIAFYDTGTSPLSGNLTINVGGNFTASAGSKTFDFSGVEALNSGNYTLVSTVGLVNTTGVNFVAAHGPYTTLFGNFTTSNNTIVYTVTGAVSGGSDIQNNGGPNTPVVANYNVTGATVTIGEENKVNALTFSNSAPLTIQSNGELTVTSGTLAVQTGSSVVSGGTLNTPGNLDKTGSGELDLQSNTNVSGVANVVAGLLSINGQLQTTGGVVVDPNATLGGSGLIAGNVNVNGGNLAPGNSPGTLTIVGNLNLSSGSVTTIEIASPTNFDRIIVSGQAKLGGTLSVAAYGGGTITPGARYDFLQAGSIVGEYSTLVAPDGLRIRFLNSGTVGSLLFGPASFVPYALNQNQINVAKALDIFVLATEGDAIVVGTALDSLTTEQFPAAFDQIMPGFYESLANMAIEQAFNQTQMLNQRISSVRLGAAGFQAIGGISQPLMHDKNGKSAAEAKDASPIVESATATNWNAWALGTGMFSRTTNLGSLQNYNNDAGGFLVGADYRWSENFVTGLYGGYDYSYAEYNGGGSTKGNSFSFGTYASYAKDGYYADAVIGGGYTGFQTQRSIEFSTIDRTASADPNSGQFTVGLNLGKDFEVGKFTLGPIVGAQYTYAGIGSFTESGAESLDLSFGQQNANSLRSTLGGRVAYTWNLNQKIALIPEVRMFWQHEFLNNPRTINASLDGGSGTSFGYETTDPYRNSVFAGAGVTAQFGKNLSGSVFYNINFGSQTYQNNMVSAGLNISF